jgi:hypothetical protein
MLNANMMRNIEGAYEFYRQTFGVESVCNHKEMHAIFKAIPQHIKEFTPIG